MIIHREGYPTISITLIIIGLLDWAAYYFLQSVPMAQIVVFILSALLLLVILQFFRRPSRTVTLNDKHILAPVDGKVVAIEDVLEPEYFNDQRKQISIFMSPTNVHINWYPISGWIKYAQYHPGKHLVAWHPKSSTENERTTIVVRSSSNIDILVRQIAGAVARRIVYYAKKGDQATQGSEMGFIKFGSRVDILLPTDAKVKVVLNQKVKGCQTILSEIG